MANELAAKQSIMPVDAEVNGPFKFASHRYGRLLLCMLVLSWIAGFFWLLYTLAIRPDLSNEALEAGEVPFSVLMMFLLVGLLIVISTAAFLLWIYKVHQDLEQLHPHYPISPRRAVAEVSIPFYNLYGLKKVFTEISEHFEPALQLWPGLIVLAYILSGIGGRFNAPAWLAPLALLAAVSIWLIVTFRIHRALGMSAEGQVEALPSPGKQKPWLMVGLALTLLAACTLFSAGALFLGRAINGGMEWMDEDFYYLGDVLAEQYNVDKTGADLWLEFTWHKMPGQETEVWLNIELEATTTCSAGLTNPCESLADEIARITLEEYGRINELAGLRIKITTIDESGEDSAAPNLEKQMTIGEWRQALNKSVVPYGA